MFIHVMAALTGLQSSHYLWPQYRPQVQTKFNLLYLWQVRRQHDRCRKVERVLHINSSDCTSRRTWTGLWTPPTPSKKAGSVSSSGELWNKRPPPLRRNFYWCIIESVLTFGCTVWNSSSTAAERKQLQWDIKTDLTGGSTLCTFVHMLIIFLIIFIHYLLTLSFIHDNSC